MRQDALTMELVPTAWLLLGDKMQCGFGFRSRDSRNTTLVMNTYEVDILRTPYVRRPAGILLQKLPKSSFILY